MACFSSPSGNSRLAIAASFAKAIGGRLSYEPCEPQGARFTLELPPP